MHPKEGVSNSLLGVCRCVLGITYARMPYLFRIPDVLSSNYVSGCQKYGPFLGLYYNTDLIIISRVPKKGPSF